MGQLVGRLFAFAQMFRRNPQFDEPIESLLYPLLMQFNVVLLARLEILWRLTEVFDLHLLELAGPKSEVSGSYLVAKRLTDLCDTKRQLPPGRLLNIQKVNENALR